MAWSVKRSASGLVKPVVHFLLMSVTLLVSPAHAQADGASPGAGQSRSAAPQRLYRGSRIIGTTVRDPQDKKIGVIKDLVLDGPHGEIAYAVINFGGVVGIGAKYHAIPWQALERSDNGRDYVLYADRETIVQAPGFDRSRWPDMADRSWSSNVDRYWTRLVGRGALQADQAPPGAASSTSGR